MKFMNVILVFFQAYSDINSEDVKNGGWELKNYAHKFEIVL